MSAVEETITSNQTDRPSSVPVLNRILDFLSSVRLGVILLCVLVALSMLGMLIMQQNVEGFEAYYVSLTPAEKLVFGSLGIFDIYHSWYFNLLLLVLSLNIILASIDRFPTAWKYIAEPKLSATRDWMFGQKPHVVIPIESDDASTAAAKVSEIFEKNGFKSRITEQTNSAYPLDSEGRKIFSEIVTTRNLYVFGESGKWNRLGAYIVHVALLTLFLGHFVALQTGFDADVRMIPGESTDQIQMIQYDLDKKEKFNVQLPFSMECTDIQQKLIDPGGSIDVTNTLDWRTQMKISDPEYGEMLADISMNKPLSYRGYRFFQAQTIPMGSARTIKLQLTPQDGGEVVNLELARNASTSLPNGTKVEFEQFLPDFTFGPDGRPDTKSGEYENPVAVLGVTPLEGQRVRVFAFAGNLAENIPVGAPKAGYKWRMTEFEKSPWAHVLSIKYDPYEGAFIAWYFGGFGLIGALIFVFFMSHKRVWAMLDRRPDGGLDLILAGNANRNHQAFEDRFNKIAGDLQAAGV